MGWCLVLCRSCQFTNFDVLNHVNENTWVNVGSSFHTMPRPGIEPVTGTQKCRCLNRLAVNSHLFNITFVNLSTKNAGSYSFTFLYYVGMWRLEGRVAFIVKLKLFEINRLAGWQGKAKVYKLKDCAPLPKKTPLAYTKGLSRYVVSEQCRDKWVFIYV